MNLSFTLNVNESWLLFKSVSQENEYFKLYRLWTKSYYPVEIWCFSYFALLTFEESKENLSFPQNFPVKR